MLINRYFLIFSQTSLDRHHRFLVRGIRVETIPDLLKGILTFETIWSNINYTMLIDCQRSQISTSIVFLCAHECYRQLSLACHLLVGRKVGPGRWETGS